jgi:cytochrome c oxidase subunit 3
MATTVHPGIDQIQRRPHAGGGGNGLGNTPPSAGMHSVSDYAPAPASTGIWVVIAGITMMFLAFTSALIVRKGGAPDWQHLDLPTILYFNTVILLASSVTLQIGRKRVVSFMASGSTVEPPATWLYVTLGLGFLFVAGQYLAWRELRTEGLYLATNPSSSFFYVLTVAHVLHLLGGFGGLGRVIYKLHARTLRRSTLDATSHYWHFMDFLWVYLFFLLWMKL